MLRPALLVAVAVAVVVALGACKPPAPYSAAAKGRPRVAVFGDSITWNATAEATAANDAAGKPFSISWNATPYLSTGHFQKNFIYMGIDAYSPEIVLIATGTNDAWPAHDKVDKAKVIGDALLVMPRNDCILWVNARSEISDRHIAWNATLVAKMEGSKARRILDWDTYSDGHPEWIHAADNVHLTAEGDVAYAEFLLAELTKGCR